VKVALAQVEVVAAAPGWIVERIDGNFDQECGRWLGEERQANLVTLAHEDGSLAIYGHLKRGSLTRKLVGERVARGEYLGAVGSSGYSSYPHLHFELLDLTGPVVDPFAGPANSTTAESWWRDQPPYYDSRFYALMTHGGEPTVACNNRERTEVKHRFAPGDEVFLVSYVRDVLQGQRLKMWVLDPDGEVVATGKYRARDPHWAIFLVTHRLLLPGNAQPGTWILRARFAGETLEHAFEVGDFEPQRGVEAARPSHLRPGARRKVRVFGSGLTRDMAAYVVSPVEVDHGVEVIKTRVRSRRVKLTLRIDPSASPGPRHVVLTASDYSQLVLENAFEVVPARVE
jgi:hypothetical protein